MNIKCFKYLCTLSQKNLKRYVFNELRKTHDNIIFQDGFVYAKGEFPVLLVAHLDTVHKHLPRTINHDTTTNKLSSPEGIGGDDRCGVYMIFEILKKYNCSVVFCEDEEIGGKGAAKFVKYLTTVHPDDIDDFNYIIELDRKGSHDAVFYDNDNTEFEDFITKEYFKTEWGTFSDISFIAPEFGISAVNLSSGYYLAHTTSEYVVTTEMDEIIKQVVKILDRTDVNYRFKYVECQYKGYYTYGKYDKYDEYDDYTDMDGEAYYCIEYDVNGTTNFEFVCADTMYEAIGKFMAIHQTVTYRDIVDIERDA